MNFNTLKTGSKGRPKVERVFETFGEKLEVVFVQDASTSDF